MKPLSDQDHYEILEIEPGADPAQIERAYKLALATYGDDSLAGYSIFGEGDAAAMRERIEMAFRVLSDPEARHAYDLELGGGPGEVAPGAPAPEPEPVGRPTPLPFEDLDEESGEFDGARLRRSRLRRGIELAQIAEITKVSAVYLRFLEEDRFEDLPAAVYARGFVKAYADCLGLDGDEVARSYMRGYRASQDQKGRSRRRS